MRLGVARRSASTRVASLRIALLRLAPQLNATSIFMNRIAYYYDLSRGGRVAYATLGMGWLRFLASPGPLGLMRASASEPLPADFKPAETRLAVAVQGIRLSDDEHRLIFQTSRIHF